MAIRATVLVHADIHRTEMEMKESKLKLGLSTTSSVIDFIISTLNLSNKNAHLFLCTSLFPISPIILIKSHTSIVG